MNTTPLSRLFRSVSFWFAVSLCFGALARGAHSQSTEYEVKAGFVHNFLQYTEFPDSARRRTLTLCVAASREVVSVFRGLHAKSVGDRSIVVADISFGATGIDCSAWFGTSEFTVFSEVRRLSRRGVLTMGETSAFLEEGGMIAFYLEDKRVRFGVNIRTVREGGVKLSSKLLSLAKIHDEETAN